MVAALRILVATRSPAACKALSGILAKYPEFDCVPRLISNGHTDPLYGLDWAPDALVLRFDDENLDELTSIQAMDPAARPPLIVVGPAGGTRAMQLAIRAGARDFLPEPVDERELVQALHRIRDEGESKRSSGQGDVHAVVGAAGGAGASLIAANVAHMMARDKLGTALVDLDINYSPLPHYLDVTSENGLLEAVDAVEDLDEVAIQGFLAKHESGLKLMSNVSRGVTLSRDLSADRMGALLMLMASHFQHIVVDCPRYVDNFNAAALETATNVVIVVQQTLLHVRNAVRLQQIVTRDLAVPESRIQVVVNRYNKNLPVELNDIRRALQRQQLFLVPNQYKLAAESLNAGVPLLDADASSGLTKAIRGLQRSLGGVVVKERGGLLSRALPKFARN